MSFEFSQCHYKRLCEDLCPGYSDKTENKITVKRTYQFKLNDDRIVRQKLRNEGAKAFQHYERQSSLSYSVLVEALYIEVNLYWSSGLMPPKFSKLRLWLSESLLLAQMVNNP
jgi:hypothetical protein